MTPEGFENARLISGWSRDRGLFVPYQARQDGRDYIRAANKRALFMPAGYVGQIPYAASQADGAAVTGTTAGTLLPASAKGTVPVGVLTTLEKKLWLKANGRISNIVTTPGTLTLDVRFGTGGTIVSTSAALQLNAVAKTNVAWTLDLILELRVIGAAAQFIGQGFWQSESVVGSPLPSVGGAGQLAWQPSAPAVGTAFDATIAQIVDFFGKFSLTGNSITCHSYELLSPN